MNSKQLSIALGIVVVALLAAVGYMALRDNSQTETLSEQNTTSNSNSVDNNTNSTPPLNTNTQQSTNTPPAQTDETANWKTYNGAGDLNFSMKYPPSWNIETSVQSVTISSGENRVGMITISLGDSQFGTASNQVCSVGTKEQVQLKNQAITMCHYLGSTQEPEGYYYTGTFSQNSVIYSIAANPYPGQNNRSTVLKILSTLQVAQ